MYTRTALKRIAPRKSVCCYKVRVVCCSICVTGTAVTAESKKKTDPGILNCTRLLRAEKQTPRLRLNFTRVSDQNRSRCVNLYAYTEEIRDEGAANFDEALVRSGIVYTTTRLTKYSVSQTEISIPARSNISNAAIFCKFTVGL